MSHWRQRYRTTLAGAFAAQVRGDAWLYAFVAGYSALGIALLVATDSWDRATYSIYFLRWLTIFAFLFPALAVLIQYAQVIHRFDQRRTLALKRAFNADRTARLLAGSLLLIVLVFFQGTFTSIKNALSVWHGGFPYDRVQADIDRWLHFGTDPWRYLLVVGDHPFIRQMVEWNYNVLWFALVFGALFVVATSPRLASVRGRYILCFMLVWIVCGNVLAGLFMSAGPAFYGEVTGDTARFAEQLSFLAGGLGQANSAAEYQAYLWRLHESGQTGFGSGISAFPSVHVGLVAMNVYFLQERSRLLALAGYAYLAFIVASSVYLGWHYAIDGYASIIVVLALHVLVRKAWRAPASRASTRAARPAAVPAAAVGA